MKYHWYITYVGLSAQCEDDNTCFYYKMVEGMNFSYMHHNEITVVKWRIISFWVPSLKYNIVMYLPFSQLPNHAGAWPLTGT